MQDSVVVNRQTFQSLNWNSPDGTRKAIMWKIEVMEFEVEQLTLPCPSPCVKHCGIDERMYCSGCLRTGRELANWPKMSDDQRWDFLAELATRETTV